MAPRQNRLTPRRADDGHPRRGDPQPPAAAWTLAAVPLLVRAATGLRLVGAPAGADPADRERRRAEGG